MKYQIELLAYTAGLLDGEGSICIGIQKPSIKNQKKSPSHFLQVGITNTNEEMIKWLYQTFGGHICDNSHSPSRIKQSPCWAWRVTCNQAQNFLELIYPYIRAKKRQAELAIEFQKMRKGLTNKFISQEDIQKRDWYKQEISKLTGRKFTK